VAMKKKKVRYVVQQRVLESDPWESLVEFEDHWSAEMFLTRNIREHVSASTFLSFRIIPVFQEVPDPPKLVPPKMWKSE
jgi:hypothetical protein